MASHRRTPAPKAARSIKQPVRSPWPHIEELVECGGNITIGRIAPIECAAVAADESNMLAALTRKKGENLLDLLERLDRAVRKATEEGKFTDEING